MVDMSLKKIAYKYNKNWVESIDDSIKAYVRKSTTYAQLMINNRQKALDNLKRAFSSNGSYEKGLEKYVGNYKLGIAYEESLNKIDKIDDYKINKVVKSVELSQYLKDQAPTIDAIYEHLRHPQLYNSPENIPYKQRINMIQAGINFYIKDFTLNSYALEIYYKINQRMYDFYGYRTRP